MGSVETRVVSSVVVPPLLLPATRLPTETRCVLILPANGAVTWLNSRLSVAVCSVAFAWSSAAAAVRCCWMRWSTVSSVPKLVRLSCCARQSSWVARSSCACAVCTPAAA